MLLSPVPTLRQKKGTGGVRLAGGKPALTMQVQYCSYIGLYCFSSIKLISGSKDRNIKAKKYHPEKTAKSSEWQKYAIIDSIYYSCEA